MLFYSCILPFQTFAEKLEALTIESQNFKGVKIAKLFLEALYLLEGAEKLIHDRKVIYHVDHQRLLSLYSKNFGAVLVLYTPIIREI